MCLLRELALRFLDPVYCFPFFCLIFIISCHLLVLSWVMKTFRAINFLLRTAFNVSQSFCCALLLFSFTFRNILISSLTHSSFNKKLFMPWKFSCLVGIWCVSCICMDISLERSLLWSYHWPSILLSTPVVKRLGILMLSNISCMFFLCLYIFLFHPNPLL